MAILKMKKLELAVLDSKRDELLRELIKNGCVQINEMDEEISGSEYSGLLNHYDSGYSVVKDEQAAVSSALAILNRFAPQKSKMLSAKPELETEAFLDETGLAAAIETARHIVEDDDRLKRISSDESREKSNVEAFTPWKDLDISFACDGTESTSVIIGIIPAKVPLDKVEDDLRTVSDQIQLDHISDDRSSHYVVMISSKEVAADAVEALRANGFTQSTLTGTDVVPKNGIIASKAKLSELKKEKKSIEDEIVGFGEKQAELKLAYDKLAAKMSLSSSADKLLHSESTAYFYGWVPEENVAEVEKIFEKYSCAWNFEDPAEDEYGTVPVKLKNNKFTNALNMVTDMYSLPRYGTLDPNPLMAPFFIIIFGLMFADMGYGILMVLAALVAMKKMKPRAGTLSFCQLLLYCGIATFAMGALTGSFFSDVIYQLVHAFNPESTWKGLPYLFNPIYQSEMVLYGSMVFGFIHLNAGLAINFYKKWKKGEKASALFEEGSMWVLFIGAALFFLDIGNIAGVPVVLIAGAVLLLYGAGREKKGLGKITAAFGCIYNTATGWFGDILSYSRIMALMLAGGVIGQVFNTVAVMPMVNSGPNVVTVIAFIIIFLLGHAMNFGLNILGSYVHDLRLQCLEYFGKFYEDGGKPFTPLRVDGKYLRTKEN